VTVMPTTLPTSDSSNGATTEEILPKTGIGDDLRTLAFAAIALLVIITIVRLLRWSVTHQDN
jgi:LPXTG-motif cell wall-anchored protein